MTTQPPHKALLPGLMVKNLMAKPSKFKWPPLRPHRPVDLEAVAADLEVAAVEAVAADLVTVEAVAAVVTLEAVVTAMEAAVEAAMEAVTAVTKPTFRPVLEIGNAL